MKRLTTLSTAIVLLAGLTCFFLASPAEAHCHKTRLSQLQRRQNKRYRRNMLNNAYLNNNYYNNYPAYPPYNSAIGQRLMWRL